MKKRILTIGGILVVVLLLAGAVFIGGQLLSGQGIPARPLSELRDIPAKELPQRAADLGGMFDHRQDQIIFVGTGREMMKVKKDQSGKVETSSNHDGPTVQVVVTSQTKIYRDVTERRYEHVQLTGQPRQQVVEAGSLDEISEGSEILVWGRKTGDRVIADVLVYALYTLNTK